MELTNEQKEEVIRLDKLRKQYEGLIKTSRNADQLHRSKIDLKKIYDRLQELCPDGVPASLSGGGNLTGSSPRNVNDRLVDYEILSEFKVGRITPNCDDDEINLLGMIMKIWEEEFIPALLDSHTKLDFSFSSERDSHYSILENLKRQQKLLINSIEDYSAASREDLKAQLREMKQRHARHLMHESAVFLKKVIQFWKTVKDDIQHGGMGCTNKNEEILFDRKFETATYLNHRTVERAISMAVTFLTEALEVLNLPELPVKKGL